MDTEARLRKCRLREPVPGLKDRIRQATQGDWEKPLRPAPINLEIPWRVLAALAASLVFAAIGTGIDSSLTARVVGEQRAGRTEARLNADGLSEYGGLAGIPLRADRRSVDVGMIIKTYEWAGQELN